MFRVSFVSVFVGFRTSPALEDPDSQVAPPCEDRVLCAMCLRLHDRTTSLKHRQDHALG